MQLPKIRLTRTKALSQTAEVLEAVQDRRTNFYVRLGGTNRNSQIAATFERGQNATYGWLYINRPAVRTVIDYIARNVAQLPLKLYERVGDTEREEQHDHPASEDLEYPDGTTPFNQFIYRFLCDFLVYDNAYLLKFGGPLQGGGKLYLERVPPFMVTVAGGRFRADAYRVWRYDGSYVVVAPEDIIHWHGYNPDDPLLGVSKLETLRDTLNEDATSQATTLELMKNGLKGGHIERPVEAPEWDLPAMNRFREAWANARNSSPRLDPVLEEGMKWVPDAISPKDAELLAGRRWTVEEVSRVYGVHPRLLGLSEGGSSTEIEDLRRQFYTDVIPPITQPLAGQFDQDILIQEFDEEDMYYEFNLNEKLRGDPDKRFQAITAAVGAPWLLRNEARALENRPPVEGGDELVTPLNVVVGELPAPNVMPPQNPNGPPQDGSHREEAASLGPARAKKDEELVLLLPRYEGDMARSHAYCDEVEKLLARYYERQRRSLLGKAVADSERWDAELGQDLHVATHLIVEREASLYYRRLGGLGSFDMDRVDAYLRVSSEGIASALNGVTQQDIEAQGVQYGINRALGVRAPIAAANIGTMATVFARTEAAKQAPGSQFRTKTWLAHTKRHASLNGATVALDRDWGGISPGSQPNCKCSVSIQ